MKVAIYARVSTSDQNLNVQQEELRAYARRREMTVVEEYTDKLSGAKDNRPGLARLIADARSRKFDAILVWKLDRFGRSLRHLVNTLADLEALGVALPCGPSSESRNKKTLIVPTRKPKVQDFTPARNIVVTEFVSSIA